jgi:hypothetical protein
VLGDTVARPGSGSGVDRGLRSGSMDLIYIVVTIIFFAIGAVYVRGCDRL